MIKHFENSKRNLKIDYAVLGNQESKNTFVIIPGISLKTVIASSEGIDKMFSMIGEKYKILLIDRRDDLIDNIKVEDMADDVIEVLIEEGEIIKDKATKKGKLILYGASQGGMIAHNICAKYPDVIDKMVTASCSAWVDDEHKKVFETWIRNAEAEMPSALNQSMWDKIYTDEYLKKFESAFNALRNDLTAYEMKRGAILSKACIDYDGRDVARKIKTKTLALASKKDQVFGYNSLLETSKILNCDIFTYEDYGHAVYDEAPDFVKRIYDFIEK